MTTSVKMRGELPFPIAGEGVVLRFTNPDCAKLQEIFGENWFSDAWAKVNRFDMKFLQTCVEIGAKKDGKPIQVGFGGLDAPMHEIAQAVLDGLFLAMHGRNFEDHLEYLESIKNSVSEEDEGNALSPENSSTD